MRKKELEVLKTEAQLPLEIQPSELTLSFSQRC